MVEHKLNDKIECPLSEEEQKPYLDNITLDLEEIHFKESIEVKCPMGAQTGKIDFIVKVRPSAKLAEFIALHKEIIALNGEWNTIETATKAVYDIVAKYYLNADILVEATSTDWYNDDPNKHMPVKVFKRGFSTHKDPEDIEL